MTLVFLKSPDYSAVKIAAVLNIYQALNPAKSPYTENPDIQTSAPLEGEPTHCATCSYGFLQLDILTSLWMKS